MTMKPPRHYYLVLVACLLGQAPLFGQATWIGADSGNWNDPANWSGTAPVDNGTSALVFFSPSNRISTNGLTNLTVSSLGYTAGGSDNTLTGNAITLTGNVTVSTGNWQTINLPIALNGARTFTVSTGQLTLNGNLSNGASSGAITKSGGGWLVLGGTNSFTGNGGNSVMFSGGGSGRVVLTNTAALPVGSVVRFSGSGSGELELQTDSSVNSCVLASGTGNGGTLIANRATAGTSVSHSLGYLDVSSITMTVNKGGNVSGNAAVSFTDVRMSGGNDNNPVTVAGNADITLGSASVNSTGITKRLQLDGTGANNVITGAVTDGISGARVNLIKANTSTWKLSGNNVYTGYTTVNGGTLICEQAALGNSTVVSIASGAVLNLTHGATDVIGGLNLAGVAQPDGIYDSTNTGGAITGTGKLQVVTTSVHIGADASLWSIPANWTGIAPVAGGTSALTFVSQSNRSSTNDIANLTASAINFPVGGRDNTLNGTNVLTLAGDVTVATGNYQTFNMPVAISGNRNFNINNGRLTLNGVISDGPTSGAITKLGGGSLFLGNANTLSGNGGNSLVFSGAGAGFVVLTHPAALGVAGKVVRFSAGGSGTLEVQTDTSVNAYSIASGTFNGGTITANRATAGTTVSHAFGILDLSSVTMTINKGGNVSGNAAVSFTELKMSGGNDYNPVTVAGNADLSIGSASITNNGISKRLQLDGTSANNTIGAISNTNNATPSAVVNVIKANSGTWTLTGVNTYTGTTSVNAGTLALVGGSQASPITVGNGAFLKFTLGSGTSSTSSVTFGTGAKVRIAGTPVPPASYTLMTAASIIGTPVLETPITGYSLVVTSGNALELTPTGFASWITNPLFGLVTGNQGPAADPDQDGTSNLMEYVFNGNPSVCDPSILPTLDASGSTLVFTYHRLDLSLNDTIQTFQYGSDLSGWTGIQVPAVSGSVGAATITVTDHGDTDSVSISIPKSEVGTSGRIFARLSVTPK